MNILDKALNVIGLGRKSQGVFGNLTAEDLSVFLGGDKVSTANALDQYAGNGWVYACARAIAEELAKMRLQLYKMNSDDTVERVYKHDVLELFKRVNAVQTSWELKYMLGIHLELTGNAYWYLGDVASATAKPQVLLPLIPKYVKIKTGTYPNLIQEYTYEIPNEEKRTYKSHQVIHFRYPDPLNVLSGMGTVQAIRRWVESENKATDFNLAFFENGARIGGFLTSSKARTKEQLEYIKNSFMQYYAGADKAHKVAALPEGVDYKENAQNRKDMDFVEGQRFDRDKILAGFRVPKTALGLTEDVNRANAEATDYVFASRTIKPKMELIVEFLNTFLLPRYGNDLFFDFENPVPEDRAQRMQEMSAAVGQQPIMSINEARDEYFGLEAIENGDEVQQSGMLVPVGAVPEAPADSGKAAKPTMKTKRLTDKSPIIKSEAKAKIIDAASVLAKAAAEVAGDVIEEGRGTGITDMTDKEFEDKVWNKFITRVTPYENLIKRNLYKFNKKQADMVKKNLPNAIKSFSAATKAIDPEDLFDSEEQIKVLFDYTKAPLKDLYEKEGAASAALIDSEFELTADAAKALDKSIQLMAQSYNETTLIQLKDVLEKGLAEGLGIPDLKKKVSDVYEFANEVRAQQVAHNETFRTANGAAKEAYSQSGVVITLKWFTAEDELVCIFCGEMSGRVIKTEDVYFNKGDSLEVEDENGDIQKLEFTYSDIEGGNLHVNCRCLIRPDKLEKV